MSNLSFLRSLLLCTLACTVVRAQDKLGHTRPLEELLEDPALQWDGANMLDAGAPGFSSRVRAKLDAGKALKIYAVGSSILGVSGGCTQPMSYLKGHSDCCGTQCFAPNYAWADADGASGWMRLMVKWLDREWPVEGGHQLINIGQPGGGPGFYEGCLTGLIPDLSQVDLVILEAAIWYGQVAAVERLVRTLLQAEGQPAVLALRVPIFRQSFTVDASHKERMFATEPSPAIDWHVRDANTDGGGDFFPIDSQFIQLPGVQTVVEHYELPSVVFAREFFPRIRLPAADPGHRDIIPTFSKDGTHPETVPAVESYGTALIAAMREFLGHGSTRVAGAPMDLEALNTLVPRRLPAPHGGPLCEAPYGEVCFGFSDANYASEYDAPVVEVSMNNGWHFAEYDRSGRTPHKPGMVADSEGASMTMVLNTNIVDPEGVFTRVVVKLMHLTSFKNMNVVDVTCAGDCSCDPKTIDGCWPEQKCSMYKASHVHVTPGERCEITLTTRASACPADSGGAQFKVMQVSTFATNPVAPHKGGGSWEGTSLWF